MNAVRKTVHVEKLKLEQMPPPKSPAYQNPIDLALRAIPPMVQTEFDLAIEIFQAGGTDSKLMARTAARLLPRALKRIRDLEFLVDSQILGAKK